MRVRSFTIGFALAAVVGGGIAGTVAALEEKKDEKEKLKACELNVCTLVTKKAPDAGDLTCALSKTWAKDKLKQGSASGKLSWGFGDARCTVDLTLPRASVIAALKSPDYTLQFAEHTVNCEIEGDKDVTKVVAKLSPKVVFKAGKAKTVLINLKEVEGPTTMKALAFTAAKLEDSVGVFHGALIGALNTLLEEKCPKVAAGG